VTVFACVLLTMAAAPARTSKSAWGDGLTLIALNVECAYWTSLRTNPWRVYLGGGPAAIITSAHEGHGHDDTGGGGFDLLLGAQHRDGLFGEIKLGLGDSRDVKVTVGVADS
jgi:hypothetical protein